MLANGTAVCAGVAVGAEGAQRRRRIRTALLPWAERMFSRMAPALVKMPHNF